MRRSALPLTLFEADQSVGPHTRRPENPERYRPTLRYRTAFGYFELPLYWTPAKAPSRKERDDAPRSDRYASCSFSEQALKENIHPWAPQLLEFAALNPIA